MAVQAAVNDLFTRAGKPGDSISIQRVWTAIGSAPGVSDYVLASPSTDLTHAQGELPRAATWTWT